MPDYCAYVVTIDAHFNSIKVELRHNYPDDATAIEARKQLVAALSFGTATDLWVDSAGKEVRRSSRAASFMSSQAVPLRPA